MRANFKNAYKNLNQIMNPHKKDKNIQFNSEDDNQDYDINNNNNLKIEEKELSKIDKTNKDQHSQIGKIYNQDKKLMLKREISTQTNVDTNNSSLQVTETDFIHEYYFSRNKQQERTQNKKLAKMNNTKQETDIKCYSYQSFSHPINNYLDFINEQIKIGPKLIPIKYLDSLQKTKKQNCGILKLIRDHLNKETLNNDKQILSDNINYFQESMPVIPNKNKNVKTCPVNCWTIYIQDKVKELKLKQSLESHRLLAEQWKNESQDIKNYYKKLRDIRAAELKKNYIEKGILSNKNICRDESCFRQIQRNLDDDSKKQCTLHRKFLTENKIKVENVRHNKVGDKWEGNNPENYKRQVDIEYFIDIYEKKSGKWVPYVASDIQFQFTMLDPYYQVALQQQDKSSATYTYKLKTPWRLGIFKFIVDFKRYGLTYIDNKMEVSVIQLRHDEFPRYETAGYPYYVNVFVLMAGSFLFVVFFTFSDFSEVKGVKKV